MSEENVERAREGFDAVNRGDWDAWLSTLSPDVVWEPLADVPGFREQYLGHVGAREWIEEVFATAEAIPETEIEQITDLGDDRVLVETVGTARGRGGGVPMELRRWTLLWLAKGLVTRRQGFRTRADALEAAGLSE